MHGHAYSIRSRYQLENAGSVVIIVLLQSNLTVAEVAANAGFDGTKDWVEMTCKLCNVSVDCSGDGAGLFRRNHE